MEPSVKKQIHFTDDTPCIMPGLFVKFAQDGAELQKTIDSINSILQHTQNLHDDRLVSVVAALVVENCVDQLLQSWIPKYQLILENKDFTFSMKVILAESMELIPRKILRAIEPVRQIRNMFAHDLSYKTFKDIESSDKGKKHLASMKGHLTGFTQEQYPNDYSKILVSLVTMIVLGLMTMGAQLAIVNKRVREKEFVNDIFHLAK